MLGFLSLNFNWQIILHYHYSAVHWISNYCKFTWLSGSLGSSSSEAELSPQSTLQSAPVILSGPLVTIYTINSCWHYINIYTYKILKQYYWHWTQKSCWYHFQAITYPYKLQKVFNFYSSFFEVFISLLDKYFI